MWTWGCVVPNNVDSRLCGSANSWLAAALTVVIPEDVVEKGMLLCRSDTIVRCRMGAIGLCLVHRLQRGTFNV